MALLALVLMAIVWVASGALALALTGGSCTEEVWWLPAGAKTSGSCQLQTRLHLSTRGRRVHCPTLRWFCLCLPAGSLEGQYELSAGKKWVKLIGRDSCRARGEPRCFCCQPATTA